MADKRDRADLLPAVADLRMAWGGANRQVIDKPGGSFQLAKRGAAFDDEFAERIDHPDEFIVAAVEKCADR